ncbi:hypothetical protein I317_07567 [Kwoniella heveanensis CBS 569]|nr:hypothetical protein I317_07567 [Kwoniella heveanensis CBS 569]
MWVHCELLVILSTLAYALALLGSAFSPTTSTFSVGLSKRASSDEGVIRGVNLGGWLLTEKWITPSLYETDTEDEWHLCAELGKKRCLSRLEDHWGSFFTRDDFEEIKSAGLNSLRIPIGYWAVDLQDDEPYVTGQYPYLIRAVYWARELGLSVLLDLHGAPGSQNGQDNSGLIGQVSFPSNTSNKDRALNVLRNLTEEFAKEEYGGVVTGIELLNEPRLSDTFTMAELKQFYTSGAETIWNVSSTMNVTIHDAFWGPQYWANYDPTSTSTSSTGVTAQHLTLDSHQYYAFEPLNDLPHDVILESICNVSKLLKSPNLGIPPTVVGEWSLETGEVGLILVAESITDTRGCIVQHQMLTLIRYAKLPLQGNAPNSTSSSQNRDNSQAKRTWFRLLFESQLAAYTPNGPNQPSIGWYYWTWKTDYDIDTWSYRRGVKQGYIPSDVSNSSTLAFPILDDGCVDSSYNYTAPKNPGSGACRVSLTPFSSQPWIYSALLAGAVAVGTMF